MRLLIRTIAVAVLVAFSHSGALFAQVSGVVRGEVTDVSGGVLPGVTVAASAPDGRVVATTVTDGVGRYVFRALPPGAVKLTFQLDGFDTVSVDVHVEPGAETRVVERLTVAQFTESVTVIAVVPADPPLAPYVMPLRPPRPVVIPVALEEMETICLPAKPGVGPAPIGTIRSHVLEPGRTLFVKGDEITLDAGTDNGIAVGRNLVVRRHYRATTPTAEAATGEQTTGLVQVVSASERAATGVVVHACSELMQGDFLTAFNPEPVRTPEPTGLPAFGDAIRILFADAGQLLGAARRLMVIDRGSAQGIERGQRLTLFRDDPRHLATPFVVGEAVVVAVRTHSATIRVERATDAIWHGDWAAPQLASPLEAPVTRSGPKG